jgi:hypothetical protein
VIVEGSLGLQEGSNELHVFDLASNKQQQQQLSLLSQASWGRLEMKPTRNKGRRSTKHKKHKRTKEKEKIMFQAH